MCILKKILSQNKLGVLFSVLILCGCSQEPHIKSLDLSSIFDANGGISEKFYENPAEFIDKLNFEIGEQYENEHDFLSLFRSVSGNEDVFISESSKFAVYYKQRYPKEYADSLVEGKGVNLWEFILKWMETW